MEEMFDIVDSDDRVVGQAPRPEVHRKGQWHRAVYIFVFNSRGELFLQERSDEKFNEPGLWTCSVSGHPSAGQGYKEAAVRETREEIGVSVDPREILRMEYSPYRHRLVIFRASHDGPFTLDPAEVKGGRHISLEKLNDEIRENPGDFSPEFLTILKRLSDDGLLDGLAED
jgi:16S rRNA (adenine1518-N6/adenine1519-N6)-dimethyltransferase